MREWQNVLILSWKRCFAQLRARCWKSLKSRAPSAKMTKHADLGLKMLFCTNSFTLLKTIKALCWKELKSGALSAKMLKRGDLRLKKLFCTNSCTLLKTLRSGVAQSENDKTCWSRAENVVSHKLEHFAKSRSKVVCSVRKWQNVLMSGWKHCFAQTRALC